MDFQNRTYNHFFHKTLIIDIETVPVVKDFKDLPAAMQHHWEHKSSFLRLSEEELNNPALSFSQRAGIYAEFGKIVCIGLGVLNKKEENYTIRLKALKNNDEAALLQEFCMIVNNLEKQHREVIFCGHNIKEFDLPYICRRLLINGLQPPNSLQLSGKKPWEILHEDTLELWRFGDYKNYISLDLLAQCLQVPSSKNEMDGSKVAQAYWEENKLDAIAKYCLQDVHTTALAFLKLKGININLTPDYV